MQSEDWYYTNTVLTFYDKHPLLKNESDLAVFVFSLFLVFPAFIYAAIFAVQAIIVLLAIILDIIVWIVYPRNSPIRGRINIFVAIPLIVLVAYMSGLFGNKNSLGGRRK